jgi:hypothetical protein
MSNPRRGFKVGRLMMAALLCHACDEAGYGVLVHVPGGSSRASRVEVALLHSCSELAEPGEAPLTPLRLVAVTADDADPIGAVEPGDYGLAGRAWDAACILYAAGCRDIVLRAGGHGTIEIFLEEIAPRPCSQGESCVDGACRVGASDGGAGLTCSEVYGTARDFMLCEETEDACEFSATLFDQPCGEFCAELGGACITAYANSEEPCERTFEDDCSAEAWDEICVCSRP